MVDFSLIGQPTWKILLDHVSESEGSCLTSWSPVVVPSDKDDGALNKGVGLEALNIPYWSRAKKTKQKNPCNFKIPEYLMWLHPVIKKPFKPKNKKPT